MGRTKSDLLHGTLELLVLRLLENEPMNGYGVGQRIEELTQDALSVDEVRSIPRSIEWNDAIGSNRPGE